MAFTNYNQGQQNNGGGQPQGNKPKSNFKVGKIYGSDGQSDVSIWKSDKGGVFTIINIKQVVGNDPSTHAPIYEQKMSGELPSVFLTIGSVRALLEYYDKKKKEDNLSSFDAAVESRGSKITFKGSMSEMKITIENQKTGTRTLTLPVITVGGTPIHADFINMIEFIRTCYKKGMVNKLDPEEFGMVANTESAGEGDSAESPF